MAGVEILNQHEEMTSLTVLFTIFVAAAVVALLIKSVYALCADEDKNVTIIGAVLMVVAIGVLVFLLVAGKRETIYQVTISDDVSINEFYEKYDIRKVEGKLYTVTEKETK